MTKKILFIEDDAVVRENTAELLELANYEVITAANGKIGVDLAKKQIPDIIVCDILMPELDGYGVLKVLSQDNKTKHIPFIYLSAKTEREDVRKGMNMGADDYITKPFEEGELISAIESRLAKVAILSEKLRKNLKNKIANTAENKIKTLEHLKNYFIEKASKFSFKLGETIYHEGDNSNFIYLIQKGMVKTYKIDEQGKELITALYKNNDLFGFTSFMHNMSYQESAMAIENTVVIRFLKQDLKNLLHNNRTVTLDLIDYLTDSVYEIKDQLLQMAYSSVRKKTANTILQFAQKIKNHPDDGIRISRSDLASVAGIATETFIRTLSGLKKDGLIDIEGRNIKILDIDKLKNIY